MADGARLESHAGASRLGDFLDHRVEEAPTAVAYSFLDSQGLDEVTWEDLYDRVKSCATQLAKHSRPGDRVLLLHDPGIEFIVSLFAGFCCGRIIVPCVSPRTPRYRYVVEHIIDDCKPAVIMSKELGLIADLTRQTSHRPILVSPQRQSQSIDVDGWDYRPSSDDLALLQYTSGSTGAPKGVMVSHANLMHNLKRQGELYGVEADRRGVIWLPPHHDMGLGSGILQPLYRPAPMLLMAPVFAIQSPLRWLEAIDRFRATVSGAPTFAFAACTKALENAECALSLDLSRWSVAFVGAEKVSVDVMDAFTSAFEPYGFSPTSITPSYGLAEATLLVAGARDGLRSRKLSGKTHAVCGQPVSDHKVIVVDPIGLTKLPDGEEGELWVSGPSVAQGYWSKEELTNLTFQAFTADGEGPFLRTGDLGIIDDGELVISGRLKEIVIVAGRKVHATDIEDVVRSASQSIIPGATIAVAGVERNGQESALVLIEAPRSVLKDEAKVDSLRSAVRLAVTTCFEMRLNDIVFLKVGQIPRTSSGKVKRYLFGEFAN